MKIRISMTHEEVEAVIAKHLETQFVGMVARVTSNTYSDTQVDLMSEANMPKEKPVPALEAGPQP